jgi:hypothetical protein
VKLATCLVMVFVPFCATPVLAASTTDRISIDDLEALKSGSVSGVNEPIPNQGGETIATAVAIPALPYSDSGNTCTNIHDYDAVCPFTGSNSPDAVYRYAPSSDIFLQIDLCSSGYDTKVYVYENDSSTLIACNDDACGSDGFRSELSLVPVTAGDTYYIVVDGYFGACGSYQLAVTGRTDPCFIACPPGSQIEGEPDCFDDYKDAYNGGCNSVPPRFSIILCDHPTATMCGEYGGYFHGPSGFQYRDTDWYELDPDAAPGSEAIASGELESLFGYVDARLGCGAPVFEDFLVVGPCEPASFLLPAHPVWLFAAPSGLGPEAGPCGSDYEIEMHDYSGPNCIIDLPVEKASWGSIKGRYAPR